MCTKMRVPLAGVLTRVLMYAADGEVGNAGSTSGLQRSSSNSPRSFSAKQFKRESDQKLARHRALQNQASSSSLMPITSPKKLVVSMLENKSFILFSKSLYKVQET